YGLTETSPTTHVVPLEYGASKPGSVGVLLPNLEARLVDENGNDVPEGEPGEFWVRGPTVMKGYHNNPEATRECMTEDGFLKTGDIVIAEKDGFYSVVDRRKELIKYKVSRTIRLSLVCTY
ncbi:acetyl-CoA synthetase-like protein, partial [Fomitiporia mediterranea MF3/22]|uniref:acetyl-CoA synthetase-like protein n=1 Tax=Fomitiporia mediterranea (strain MF3/22) TaxID=694068 RepID=UPI000440989C